MEFEESLIKLFKWMKCQHDDVKKSGYSFISPKVRVKSYADSGRGIQATEKIAKGETLVKIEPSYLLNSSTVIETISRYSKDEKMKDLIPLFRKSGSGTSESKDKYTRIYEKIDAKDIGSLSAFQLMSFFICFEIQRDTGSSWQPFLNLMPDMKDFEQMPLTWKVLKTKDYEFLLLQLPRSTQQKVESVYNRFQKDYDAVQGFLRAKIRDGPYSHSHGGKLEGNEVLDYIPINLFLYSWICINSRCLYMDNPLSKNKDDCMTMAPYVDFLNHCALHHCGIKASSLGFYVFAMRDFEPGEQLFLSYGPHSNEFLLCEYGFMLVQNHWNDLNITEYITKLLLDSQKEFLQLNGYYGDYTVSSLLDISFRTEVALAVLQEEHPQESRPLKALINGYYDGASYDKYSKQILRTILNAVIRDCNIRTSGIKKHADKLVSKCIQDLYGVRLKIASQTIESL